MAKEREIVCLINDAIEAALPTFKNKAFNNIAIERERSDGITELIETVKAKADKKIFPDDSQSLMIFHKYSGSSYEEKRGYGASQVTYQQEANMALIAVANRKRLQEITDDKLEFYLANIIGITLTKAQLIALELISCSILIRSSEINAGIIVREFPEIKRNTYPDICCLEIRYSIITKYGAGCADLCLTN